MARCDENTIGVVAILGSTFDGSLSRSRYTRVLQSAQDVAVHISSAIDELAPCRLLTEGRDLPVFAFTLAPGVAATTCSTSQIACGIAGSPMER